MTDFAERRDGRRADFLGRAFGVLEFRVRFFKLGQSAAKGIILCIGNLGRVLTVIERIMALDFRR